ncbi:MAG: TIGR00282 family metallophosphoesterase [Bacilli bacterium]|nr:TIGR00282 family metallophosphoesterase [Bacilli bacterium]
MNILFFGDIVGRIGLTAVSSLLPTLRRKYEPDLVIANGENVSKGRGLTEKDLNDLLDAGIDVVTLGNHWHDKQQIDDYIDDYDQLIRPVNILNYYHGVGSAIYDVNGYEVRVTNVLGQAFMKEQVESPLAALTNIDKEEHVAIHIVDFHADSTSEKQSLAYAFDGKVSAFLGTHTHVQTNDARILPGGTAFMCDVGMCGSYDSVIGFEKKSVVDKVVYGNENSRFQIEEEADTIICGAFIEIDEETGLAIHIEPINIRSEKGK